MQKVLLGLGMHQIFLPSFTLLFLFACVKPLLSYLDIGVFCDGERMPRRMRHPAGVRLKIKMQRMPAENLVPAKKRDVIRDEPFSSSIFNFHRSIVHVLTWLAI